MKGRYTKYHLLLLLIFLSVQCAPRKIPPEIKDGILDLTNHDFQATPTLPLNGKADFFWGKFYSYEDFTKSKPTGGYKLPLSQIWHKKNSQKVGIKGYGTYHIKLKLPHKQMSLALKMFTVSSAYKLFINEQKLIEVGKIGTNKKTSIPQYLPLVLDFNNPTREIDLIIQVSNFHNYHGGLWQQTTLGLKKNIREQHERSSIIELFLVGSIFIMALYHFGLYLIKNKNKSVLYFALLCTDLTIRLLVTSEYLVHHFFNTSWHNNIRLEYLTINFGPIFLGWFLYSLYPQDFPYKVLQVTVIIFSLLGLSNIFLTPYVFSQLLPVTQIMILFLGCYAIFGLTRATIHKREGARLIILGFVCFFATVVNDILYVNHVINTKYLLGPGLFMLIFSQAFVLAYFFSKAQTRAEELSEELNYTNKNLERLVENRTQQLQEANHMLSAKNELINKTNKNITDSISYASNIQRALIPPKDGLKQSIPEYFILYKPRDIVSGDFYWFSEVINEKTQQIERVIFAVVDCTGHGVPGAFMSMLGIESLNNVINQRKITEPQDILTKLHEHISETLRKGSNKLSDGMDIALSVIDLRTKTLTFAGAHNPLIIIQNSELKTIKGSPISIGGYNEDRSFTQHSISLETPSMLYMFSDGYQDQFGGKNNRKFMKSRLRKLLLTIYQEPAQKQKEILKQTIEDWMDQGNEQQIDDILFAGIRLDL